MNEVHQALANFVIDIGYSSEEEGSHGFSYSGASFTMNQDVCLNKITMHGHWKSDAIWLFRTS